MLFRWLTERRRKALREQPLPPEWDAVIARNVAHWKRLDDDERARLRDLVQVFVAEKHWEGCGGLELTDEIRVTIAAQACVLLLGRDHDLYADVESILVYPHTVVTPARPQGIFTGNPSEPSRDGQAILGQAHLHGPVILVWDSVRRGARRADDGHNVVFHEFAHKIDMLDGGADGTPPLEEHAALRNWAEVCSASFEHLKSRTDAGRSSFFDAYGATNEAEFFAVATESFFERPEAMKRAEPALYDLFAAYYRQDPAARAERD
jgi:Mlc titration factor MtfA (ptsG expression regulator)